MRLLPVIALAATLAGCEKPEVVSEKRLGVVQQSAYCNKVGYCMTCAPGFDGKAHCGLKFSGLCPGSKTVEGEDWVQTLRYKSKPDKLHYRHVLRNEKDLSACS